jgi:hypothetical protein
MNVQGGVQWTLKFSGILNVMFSLLVNVVLVSDRVEES